MEYTEAEEKGGGGSQLDHHDAQTTLYFSQTECVSSSLYWSQSCTGSDLSSPAYLYITQSLLHFHHSQKVKRLVNTESAHIGKAGITVAKTWVKLNENE